MRFRLPLSLVLATAALIAPGQALASDAPPADQADATAAVATAPTAQRQAIHGHPSHADLRLRLSNLRNGRVKVMSKVQVVGTLIPFVPGQWITVYLYRNGHQVGKRKLKAHRGSGNFGIVKTRVRADRAAKFAASAKHVANGKQREDHTVRKSWKVTFPSLSEGECGRVVVGFKKAMRKMGYITNGGRCLGGKTSRGVLAYRKVNNMDRNFDATSGIVKSVYAGKGAYKVRHPGSGTHVEAPLSKQVIVFAKGDKPIAVYPISSGKPSTPTITGHFNFYMVQPGYNAEGMYYSFYFYGGYAVHGYESVPNYAASHGCLRTFIADQPEIYNRISYGEDIFVW